MGSPVFFGNVLKDHHFMNCTAGAPDFESAFRLVESHFRMTSSGEQMVDRFRDSPDLIFRVYRSEGDGWNSAIVEVLADDKRPMMPLAVYKIMQGEWANS